MKCGGQISERSIEVGEAAICAAVQIRMLQRKQTREMPGDDQVAAHT